MENDRILIVEDEAIIAMEIENQVQGLGYEVTSIVDTGEKAIKKAEEDKPDLILMDIRIKGEMDGIEAAEEIRNRFGIPVIFSTAYLDEERIERAKITMPFGYVLKPIQERDLKVTIEMALYVAKVDTERKKSEIMFSQMFEQSKTSTQLYDPEGTCIRVNPQFCELFGVEAEMITDGRYNVFKDQAAIDSGVIPLVKKIFEEKKTNKWTINFDIAEASDSTGTPSSRKEKVWIDVLGYPILDSEGNLEYVIFQHYDITKSKQADKSLRERESKYRLLADNVTDVIFTLDMDLKYTYVSPSVANLRGFSPNEIMGLTMEQTLVPDSLEKATHLIMKELELENKPTVDLNRTNTLELEMVHKDGSTIWTEVKASFLRDSLEKPVGILGVTRDITEHKKIEEALQKAHNELEQQVEQHTSELVKANEELRLQSEIMTNMSEGVYLVRADDGIIVFTNPKFEQMFGYAPKEMVGKHVSIVNAPTERNPKETAEEIMGILNKTGIWQGKVYNIKKDGTPFWCYANVSVFDHAKYGKVLVSVHTEFIERKKSNE